MILALFLGQFVFAETQLNNKDEYIDRDVESALEKYTSEQMLRPGAVQKSSSSIPVKNGTIQIRDDEFGYIDPQRIVPTEPLKKALQYFKANQAKILNQKYITVIDMTQHSSKKRMYVINMQTGAVVPYLVAHGKNSDKNNDGYADSFSNVDGSLMTSLGFYLTDNTYNGKYGLALKLRGQESTNSNAYARAIVMHGAAYVNPSRVGRSFGCPAVEEKYSVLLSNQLKGKSLLYIWKK